MNPREYEILNLLAKPAAPPAPVPASPDTNGLGLYESDLMDAASGTASEDVTSRVARLCQQDADAARRFENYQRFMRNEPVEEPPVESSILGRMKTADLRQQPLDAGWTDLRGTSLGQSSDATDHKQLLARLAAWLPLLVEALGLRSIDVESFLADAATRLPLSPGQRFRDELPRWLAEAASVGVESIRITPELVARMAVLVTASRAEEGESAFAKQVREYIISKGCFDSPDALTRGDYPAELSANPAFRPLVRDLAREARKSVLEGLTLFEIGSAA